MVLRHKLVQRHIILDIITNLRPPGRRHGLVIGSSKGRVGIQFTQAAAFNNRPHPLIDAGEKEFNSFIWIPPAGDRAADVLIADSTIFSTLFGADASLERFWTNLVTPR